MSIGTALRLKSVVFRDAVRLPGSSSSAHYIASEDYPLTYYPELHLIEARCRSGVTPQLGHTSRIFYYASASRDMQVDEADLANLTAAKVGEAMVTQAGVLAAPVSAMRQGPGGSFERVVEETHPTRMPMPRCEAIIAAAASVLNPEAPPPVETESAHYKPAPSPETPAPRKGGWPKGKPRGPRIPPTHNGSGA